MDTRMRKHVSRMCREESVGMEVSRKDREETIALIASAINEVTSQNTD